MTREIRTLIETTDIIAAEFECLHCRARITINVADYQQINETCPSCKRPWFASLGGPTHSAAHQVIKSMKGWADLENNKDVEIKVRMRLQLRTDKAEA